MVGILKLYSKIIRKLNQSQEKVIKSKSNIETIHECISYLYENNLFLIFKNAKDLKNTLKITIFKLNSIKV
jgi:hypothetical protein